ncbi:zinc finger MYM-type protein 1-like [Aphis craccivora]|uniref:Zinc finger MYM-type protein 1-like n=1 Tax=Aphis craccivora TaxID=307492 RepID=A0A6G0Z010_APHCR|nr:zinc finger MYM-type protein 1-like [Aphis craccivora]
MYSNLLSHVKNNDIFNIFKMKPQASTSSNDNPHDAPSLNSIIFSTVTKPLVQSHELSHDPLGLKDLGNIETGPIQPKLQLFSVLRYPKKSYSSQNGFSVSYFAEFNWLEYSLETDSVYCFPCRMFGTKPSEETLTSKGFNNWKKLSGSKGIGKGSKSKLQLHSATIYHINCMTKWSLRKKVDQSGSIYTSLSNAHREVINQNYIKGLIDILLFLARQGLAFKGNDDRDTSLNQGNFKEMCKLLSDYNSNFNDIFSNEIINYTSPKIQNELIDICADNLLNIIVDEVNYVSFFQLCVMKPGNWLLLGNGFECKLCHKQEYTSICIRYAKDFNICECFLGFVEVSSNQNADSLSSAIISFLKKLTWIKYQLLLKVMMEQVLSGSRGGVKKKLKDYYPYVSNKLQNTNGTLSEAACLIYGIINSFENSRNLDSFSDIWNEIVTFSVENNIDLTLSKRKRKEPAVLKDFRVTTTTGADGGGIDYEDNAKEYWKNHAFYPVIDSIIVNMKHRFSPDSLKLAISIDNFINLDYKQSEIFVNKYKLDFVFLCFQALLNINEIDLKSELLVPKNCYDQLKNINNPQEHLKRLQSIVEKSVFPNLYKMLHLALSVPTSSASCERTFSAMRRINTYIRSTMLPNRFSKLSIIAIETD